MSAEVVMQNPIMYSDYDSPIVGVNPEEDQRALQIALQLSNLALLGREECNSYEDFLNGKKTQNMTECVPVPSSEHVAEIVGKQGKWISKVKFLKIGTDNLYRQCLIKNNPVLIEP